MRTTNRWTRRPRRPSRWTNVGQRTRLKSQTLNLVVVHLRPLPRKSLERRQRKKNESETGEFYNKKMAIDVTAVAEGEQ